MKIRDFIRVAFICVCLIYFCPATAQDEMENPQEETLYRIPAITGNSPDALAKGYLGTMGFGATFQSRTLLSGQFFDPDGNASLSLGLGNPESIIGAELRVNIFGMGNKTGAPNNLGEGTFDLHLSRAINDRIWAGAGMYNITGWKTEPANKLKSLYFTVTALVPLSSNEVRFFNNLYVTAGVGNGRFRSNENYTLEKEGPAGFFISASVQVLPEGNFIVEWTGHNMLSGFSFYPFRKFPGQLMIGVNEIFNKKWQFLAGGSCGLYLFKKHYANSLRERLIPPPPPPQTSRV